MWDPYSVLDVNPNGRYCTCVGIASSTGRRCRWSFDSGQFSTYQARTAADIMKSMSNMHPAKVTTATLYQLARNTLCRDFHQGQASAKSAEWKAEIDDYLRPVRQLQNGITKDEDASEQEIEELHETVERVTADLKASQFRCSGLTEKWKEDQKTYSWDVARLKERLTDFRATAKALDDRNSEVRNLKKQLEGRNANHEKEIRALKESKTRLETMNILEIDTLKAGVRHRDKMLDERASTSEKEADSLRQQLAASNSEVMALEEAKASSDKLAKSSEKEAEKIRQELRESNARYEALEAKSTQDSKHLSQQFAVSNHEIMVLKEAKASSDEKAGSSEKETENVRQELRETNVRHEALAAKSSQDSKRWGRELEAVNQKYAESKKENAVQISRLQERYRKIEQLEEQAHALNQDLAKRDRLVDDLVKQANVLKEELAEREVGGNGTV